MIDECSLTHDELVLQVRTMREQLNAAQEMIRAIRNNEVDALVVGHDGNERVCTLDGADRTYRVLVEAMHQGAATIASDGSILYCNQYLCEALTGVDSGVVGQSIYDYVSPEDEGLLRALLWEAISASCVGRRIRMLCPDGTEFSALLTAMPQEVEGVRAVCLVVTNMNEHEALIAANAANAAKDRFLAVLSHELRTPLTPALMAAAALEQDQWLPEAARQKLGLIRRNVELEVRLIDDLLDLNRIASGKLRLDRRATSVHDLLSQVVAMLSSDIQGQSLQLRLDLQAIRDQVLSDPARMQQVFWNLLRNAVKFTPAGGTISIRSSNPADGRICIGFSDTGIGIPAELLPRLFLPFEQGESERTGRHGGLGLGLAICKAIVELHGGSICASSCGPGLGAAFEVELPAMDVATPRAAQLPAGQGGEEMRSLRMLLVEDHADTAEMLQRLLESFGHTVRTARTASDALNLADREPFDLVLSDLGLPDATGYQLISQLRTRSKVKAIAISGYGMEGDVQKSLRAGFDDHLVKPLTLDRLFQAIRQLRV